MPIPIRRRIKRLLRFRRCRDAPGAVHLVNGAPGANSCRTRQINGDQCGHTIESNASRRQRLMVAEQRLQGIGYSRLIQVNSPTSAVISLPVINDATRPSIRLSQLSAGFVEP